MLSQTAEYALRASVFLAAATAPSSPVREISRGTRVPASYLTKVLVALGRAGIVRAQRGPNGGYGLRLPPESVSVLDVIRAVEPQTEIETCPLGLPEHASGKLCALHRHLADAYLQLEAVFRNTTLQDLTPTTTDSECPFPRSLPTGAHLADEDAPVPSPTPGREPTRRRGTVGQEDSPK